MTRPTKIDYKKYNKGLIEDLYLVQNLSRGGVCEKLGIEENTFRAIIRYWKIKKSPKLQKICQEKGIKAKSKSGWYVKNSIKTWQDPKSRERILKAQEKSRTDEWRKHISEGQKGKKQPESQKQKMREYWKNGKWDFFRSDEFWKSRREKFSRRSKKQFANLTDEQRKARSEHLSEVLSKKETQDKRNQTFRKNGTWTKSAPEELFAKEIVKIFPNTKRQYRSDLYPFNCDFYIPERDLYIEINLHWTHGRKQYLGTKKDIQKVNCWKSKKTKYYDTAIYVWTELDVKKRNIAKENKLNFVELFSWEDCQQFLVNFAKNGVV